MIHRIRKIAIFFTIVIFQTHTFAKEISLMNYNLYNMFDSEHDEGKKDYEFLPLELKESRYQAETEDFCKSSGPKSDCASKDWTTDVYAAHIKTIADVIRQYEGNGPDILVMQEVENAQVLKDLIKELSAQNYKYFALIENTDARGIDVGVISKLPIKKSALHNPGPEYQGVKRGILQVDFQVGKSVITILGNHWPSPRSANTENARINASKHFRSLANSLTSDLVIGTGDFNTTDQENTSKPKDGHFKESRISETKDQNAIHILYDEFQDVKPYVESQGMKTFPGTYYFKNKWTVLDRFLIRKKDLAKKSNPVKPNYGSFLIFHPDFLFDLSLPPSNVTTQGSRSRTRVDYPVRFEWKTKKGYSDHLPITMKINIDN
ncbi:MAG: hypothetical protein QE271_11750 [Bacteriovoracaceae bacterium]|nr:hypothetical protein [Bacteriovoracaceae bacterium]